MSLVVALGGHINHQRILIVMEDQEKARKHAKEYCKANGYELDKNRLKVRIDGEESSLRIRWVWPKDVSKMYASGKGKWVYLFAGLELTRIELHTEIAPEDLNYLIGRLRTVKG